MSKMLGNFLKLCVRKHRAPKGALRPWVIPSCNGRRCSVRKHRAPKGALRRSVLAGGPVARQAGQKAPSAKRCIKTTLGLATPMLFQSMGQKAPSAKRCIKTNHGCVGGAAQSQSVRKHRAPKGALRLRSIRQRILQLLQSQKAPSAKRCIKTGVEQVRTPLV